MNSNKSKEEAPPPTVLSATVYASRFTQWFGEGGRRGQGVLHRRELANLAWRDLHRYFGPGDREYIRVGKRGRQPKWRNQLAWALVNSRQDDLGALIIRQGSYYYHLDYVRPDWASPVRTPRRPKRSPNTYRFLRDGDLARIKAKKNKGGR
jgi:hypothetical protein